MQVWGMLIDPSTVFSPFDMDQLVKILWHHWTERLQISNIGKLQKLIEVCKLAPTKCLKNFVTSRSYIFVTFREITNHFSFKALFQVVNVFGWCKSWLIFFYYYFLYIYSKMEVREEITFVRRAIKITNTSEEAGVPNEKNFKSDWISLPVIF